MPKGTMAGLALASGLALAGCATTAWDDADWRGHPIGELTTRLGAPSRVLEVSPALLLRFWGGLSDDPTYPAFGVNYRAVFLVRGDGIVLGAPVDCWCGSTAKIAAVIEALGRPTKEVRSKLGSAWLTWEPQPGGVRRALALRVTPDGFVYSCN